MNTSIHHTSNALKILRDIMTIAVLSLIAFAITFTVHAQEYSPTPPKKTHILGELFKTNNLRYVQFNRCTGDGKLQEACKQGTPENAVLITKPTGTFEDGEPTGKGVVKGYRDDEQPFTWVNDENVLTLSFPDHNECYFIVGGKYLVGSVDEKNPYDWKVLVNQK